jgi:cyclohexyl-isocyanide hydratase
MKVAFCLYDGMTALDFVGAYDAITRLERMDFLPVAWDVCAREASVAATGLDLGVDRVKPPLGEYDLVFFPGGVRARELRHEESFIEWVQTAETCDYLTSVCTGSLLLGAAGFLEGRKATTHPVAFDTLAEYTEVLEDRVVQDGNVITARGVSSSIDLGLYVVELLTDGETRQAIAEQMDHPDGSEAFTRE